MSANFWTEEEIAIIIDRFKKGMNDQQITEQINEICKTDRSRKAVATKRLNLGMTTAMQTTTDGFTPIERPGGRGRKYSIVEDKDIIDRYDRGEPIASIALSYGAPSNTIANKIDRMLEQRLYGQKRVKTPRTCLSCGRTFLSVRPKSMHRRCDSCTDNINRAGTCFGSMRL